ncbi:MAG: DUF5808 domain-containing protein [Bacteroidota bacterium]
MGFFDRLKPYFSSQNTGKDFEQEKPENWVLGIFYFNRKDYRFFLPKRDPMMGWTFNFAHPIAYLVLIAIIVIAYLSTLINR